MSWQQPAMAVEESMVNDKNNYQQQKYVEAIETATQKQSSKVFSIIRDTTGKLTASSATNVNKRNGDSPANRDESIKECEKRF